MLAAANHTQILHDTIVRILVNLVGDKLGLTDTDDARHDKHCLCSSCVYCCAVRVKSSVSQDKLGECSSENGRHEVIAVNKQQSYRSSDNVSKIETGDRAELATSKRGFGDRLDSIHFC